MPALTRRGALTGLATAGLSPAAAQTAEFPRGTIEIVVPATAGGGTDVGARLAAEQMRDVLGQPVIVDNRPGAGGAVGTTYVARGPKTGALLGIASDSSILINPLVIPNVSYKMEDFQLLTPLYTGAFALTVGKDFPARTVREFVAEARKQGSINCGMFGSVSSPRLVAEMLCAEADIRLTPVPYRGENEGVLGVLSGTNPAFFGTTASVVEHHKAGSLRILALSLSERIPILPDVPTFAEEGFGTVNYRWFHGLMLPAGTPKPIVQRFSDILKPIITSARFKAGLGPDLNPTPMSPEEFTAFGLRTRDRVAGIIRDRNLKV